MLTPTESETRSAATAWFYALHFEPDQEISLLMPLLKECYPNADLDAVQAMVKRQQPYQDITDELVDEVLDATHTEGYEILPWREAAIRVLAIDFLNSLKASSAFYIEDTLGHITSILDDKLRGTTKNACQLVSGQRTRLRKVVRTLVLAALYLLQYEPDLSPEAIQEQLMGLILPDTGTTPFFTIKDRSVKPYCDAGFCTDDFPIEGLLDDKGELNARGRYAICEAIKTVRKVIVKRDELDEKIQNSSKRWRISRMSLIDLNILRMAAYELFYEKVSTPKIMINEAVELAKIYGAEQSKNFVNGILQQLCNDNHIEVI